MTNLSVVLAQLRALTPDQLMTAVGLALVFLLLLILSVYLVRRQRARRRIGLARIEANYPENHVVPTLKPRDPLENDGIEDLPQTSYSEKVNLPDGAAEPDTEVLDAEASTRRPSSTPPAQPVFQSALQPTPQPAPESSFFTGWSLLQTLPFVLRPGLTTGHIDMLGISVEAVFFPAEEVNQRTDPLMRLVPFLPEEEGELICREADRRTFSAGGLFAQPDAVIALQNGTVLSLEYKSRGGRLDDPKNLAASLRPKDLLQTVISAMVLSACEGTACAPVLRTHGAVYFLRPGKALLNLLAGRIAAARAFVDPYSTRPGISTSDYAALCVVPAEMLSGALVTDGSQMGEKAHAEMLR